jgi:hypothetical protein
MKTSFIRPALVLLAVAGLVMGGPQALSAEPVEKPAKSKIKKKAAKGQAGRLAFVRGSEETAVERSTRLKRECRGGVNAGACAGYTR